MTVLEKILKDFNILFPNALEFKAISISFGKRVTIPQPLLNEVPNLNSKYDAYFEGDK